MSIILCNGRHDVEGYDYNGSSSEEATAAHVAACHEVSFEGAVLRLRERNGYDDSDFYALVWDEEQQRTREIQYATTRGWTYHNGASIDATHEVIEAAVAHTAAVRFADAQERHNSTPRKGYTARAVEKGETFEGVITWIGEKREYSQWAARYATPVARYGIKVEGRKGLVFANADDEGFAFDAEPVSEADMVEWRANCERSARAEFSQALAIADQRPQPPAAVEEPSAPVEAVSAPQAAEEAQERHTGHLPEDAAHEGVQGAVEALRAAGESLAVLTDVPGDWSAVGALVMPGSGSTPERAGVRVVHYIDGRSTERPGPGKAQQRQARNGALDGYAGALREAGWSVALQEDRTAAGRCVRALLAWPPAAEERPEPVYSKAAMDAVWPLLDDTAPRYRRTVLGKGGAVGCSDTMEITDAWLYLVEEVTDGGRLERHEDGRTLRLTRANGARLELAPVVEGAVPLGG